MNPIFFLFFFFSSLFHEGVGLPGESVDYQTTKHYWIRQGEEDLLNSLNLSWNTGVAKNIIIFVGDGMGPNTITAARIYAAGESGSLQFEKFPHVGLLKTYAVDKTVADSACSGTALFSGVKTNYEVAGLDGGAKFRDCKASLKEEHRLTTLADWAQDAGKDTGFVTTTRVTHATPAALYSKSPDRKWECDSAIPLSYPQCKDIGRQLVEDLPGKKFKVIMGGGRQSLTWNITGKSEDPIDTWACKRNDGRDLITQWEHDRRREKVSYRVLRNSKDLKNLNHNTEYVLGVFSNTHMPYEDLRNPNEEGTPSLAEMTIAAIKVLSKNPKGFFLMVEGGLIDYAHHRNYARRALEETVMLSKAVEEAMKLTGDDTLIVVTSDHSHNLNINGNTGGRNDILGVAMNSKIDGVPYTTLTYSTGSLKSYTYVKTPNGNIQRKDPTTYDATAYEEPQQAGILNDEATHGGVDVAVFAKGPMAHLFHGVHEQTYVAHVMAYAAKIGRYSRRPEFTATQSLHQKNISNIISTSLALLIVGFLLTYYFRS